MSYAHKRDTGIIAVMAKSCGTEVQVECNGDQKKRSQYRQYLACFIVNVLSFSSGSTNGWMAPMQIVLQAEDTQIGIPPISDTDASWLASITCLSRLITIPLYGYTMERFGHKVTGYIIAATFTISWALLLFANSMTMLLCARFITGLAFSGILILVPSYTIDIAEDSIKGRLGVVFSLSMNVGVTFAYIMGSYASYMVFHIAHLSIPIIFVVAFYWIPESPLTLMVKGEMEAARDALRWLRDGEESEFELKRIEVRAQEILNNRKQKVSLKTICDRSTLRGLLICVGLILNQQLIGTTPILSYTLDIFKDSGTTLPASIATIMIGIVQVVGTLLSTISIEKYGRRILLISSETVIALCLFVLGAHLYLKQVGYDVEIVNWLPVVCLSIYILSVGIGVGPIPLMIVSEMVTPQARNLVQSMSVVTISLSMFATNFSFMPFVQLVGQYGCFWLYGVVCVVGLVCVFFTMPETKNRSIEDVVEQLKSDDYIRSVLRWQINSSENAKHQISI